MTTTPTPSTSTPTKTTSPRSGNPPRWLVVVLVLVVGVGFGVQTRPKPKPKVEPPESQSLGIDHVLPLTTRWPMAQSLQFTEHSLAHDPATDHFWVVTQVFSGAGVQPRLEVAASLDGGLTLEPPVDVMPLLPPMYDLQSALTYGPDKALYLAVQGVAGKQGQQQVGILRSTDEGATWSLWWHRPENGYRLARPGFQLIPWNTQLVLLYSAQKSGAPSGLFAEILQTDGTATSPKLIAADPPNDDRELRHVLATPSALHMLAHQGGGPAPRLVALCGLTATGEVLPVQALPIAPGHRLVDAALLAEADGDPVVLVKLDTPPSGLVGCFSRNQPKSQLSDPRTPTIRYSWDAQSRQWNLHTREVGPALFSGMGSPAEGMLMSILVHPTEAKSGFFIDGLDADGRWSDRWELTLPWDSWRQTVATIQLSDGRLVILGTESGSAGKPPREVLLITDPLPGITVETIETVGTP